MNSLLKNAFIIQIKSKQGFDFEDFIDELYLLKYGADDYVPIRRGKDKGNDGTIISERKILACYAPEKYSKTSFERKVLGNTSEKGDFPKYIENWKTEFGNWEMLVNHEVSPDQLKIIDDLDGDTSIKGITQLITIIENDLPKSKVRKLAVYLGISDYFKQDYIREILDDLLSKPSGIDNPIEYLRPMYIGDKIKLNFKEEELDNIDSEFDVVFDDFNIIAGILKGYIDDENKTIKWRIINDFGKLSGSFKEKLDSLTDSYTREYANIDDDEYKRYVKTVLLYMFEQCFIGKKTNEEK